MLEAEGTYVSPQLEIQTPNVRGRLNLRLSRGLNPCTRVVAFLWFGHFRDGINSFSIAAFLDQIGLLYSLIIGTELFVISGREECFFCNEFVKLCLSNSIKYIILDVETGHGIYQDPERCD